MRRENTILFFARDRNNVNPLSGSIETKDTWVARARVCVQQLLYNRGGITRLFGGRVDVVFKSQVTACGNEHFWSLSWFVFVEIATNLECHIAELTLVYIKRI